MKRIVFSAIAGIAVVLPLIAQARPQSAQRQVAGATRAATLQPGTSGFVNAAHIFPFSEDAIFQAYVAPGLVTDIVLQPGEALIAVASGDTARWVIGDTTSGTGETRQTHILVKPFSAGLTTNPEVTARITEWQPTTPRTVPGMLFFASALAVVALDVVDKSPRQTDGVDAGMQVKAMIFNRDDGVFEVRRDLIELDILPLLVEPEPWPVVGVVENGVTDPAIQLVNRPGMADRPVAR